jgi:hypothetical protein
MPFKDNPLRHVADITGKHCSRCGESLPTHIEPLTIVCSKTDGWVRGDLLWAKDCNGDVVQTR